MEQNANAALDLKSAFDDPETTGKRPVRALPAPGTCVANKYILCDVLGRGGSAIVYAAEQLSLRRVVAFKLYPASGELASALLQRFEREAQLLARVHHENVVGVFDAGSMPDGSPYLVVQRLSGESLATHLSAGPLALSEAVELARQVLNALIALSDAGITHRDIKPENLVLDRPDEGRTVLKLVDFGIAKQAGDEASPALDAMVGTPRYMAPEQVRGVMIDARCDQYALGVTLYQMLTGRTPHTGNTVEEIASAALFAPITPVAELRSDCPAGLSRIVMRALARDPADRFQSAREMKRALERWQSGTECNPLEETLRICTLESHTRRVRRRRPKLLLPALLVVLALAGSQLSEASTAQAGMFASDLLNQARASTGQLLETLRDKAHAWSVTARAIVRDL